MRPLPPRATTRPRPFVRLAAVAVSTALLLTGAQAFAPAEAASYVTMYGTSTPAGVSAATDKLSVELGTRFTPRVNGSVIALKYYKTSATTGTHTGALWSPTGSKLAGVTFTNETSTGWQTAALTTAVPLKAGQTYTVSYHAPNGRYAYTSTAPATVATSSALVPGAGVFRYGSSSAYPTSVWRKTRYWTDIQFVASAASTPPSASPTATPSASVTATPSPTPTASASVTATPSPTPSSSTSATATPTATPTPTPTASTSVGTSGWPNATNTGVPAGTVLRTVKTGDSGPGWSAEMVGGSPVLYVRTSGAVLDALNIPMCVKVMANNVTIKRSRISCASYYTVNVSDPPTYYSGLNLTDVEIDGQNSLTVPGIAVMASANATYTRLNVHGFGSSGPRLATGTTLQDSWIHGFVCAPGEHSAGVSANDGGTGIKVLRNNIDISTGAQGCASNSIGIYHDFGTYDGVQIIGNRVSGGAYCIYTAQSLGSKNVRVEGNVFGREYYSRCGQYGPVAQVQAGTNGNTFTGNTWSDGTPVS